MGVARSTAMKRVTVKRDMYVDSVMLMLASRDLENHPSVQEATVAMGTAMNVQLLLDQGFPASDLCSVTPSDLVMAIDCNEDEYAAIVAFADELLAGKRGTKDKQASHEQLSSIDDAVQAYPDINLAIISVPGIYAAHQARKALHKGLHVMLFSDNVSLEDEISLKRFGKEKGLLVMGPDCGTAIIAGKPLCFANVVERGSIGVVAASGTGLQEVTSLIDRFGGGISQAIGTGGRDLKNKAVGGAMMSLGIAALASDERTSVIVVVSKPPAAEVVEPILLALSESGKPSVVHFIGSDPTQFPSYASIHWTSNLEETARVALSLAGSVIPPREHHDRWAFDLDHESIDALVRKESASFLPEQKNLRGYYTGGTLADEAWLALADIPGGVWSNNHTDPAFVPKDPHVSLGNTIIDLGDDVFTVGRPHPMIDPSTRVERMLAESDDPSIAVMLLDCVLGFGSCDDPAGAMVPVILKAKKSASDRGGYLSVIASVTGTASDPQGFASQVAKLENAGVVVMSSNYQAVQLAKRIVMQEYGPGKEKEGPTANPSGKRQDSGMHTSSLPVEPALSLFREVRVANLGLQSFADTLGPSAMHLDWRPPAGGDLTLIHALSSIDGLDLVASANAEAVEKVLQGKPTLLGIGKALDTIPGMREGLILHAGPPITWNRMCGPMKGAVIGALIYEGKAKSAEEAVSFASSGAIEFEPCHHHSCVGPMAGVITASMPVWILENAAFGNRAYATLNEGLGKVLRYGAYSQEVIDRLKWMEQSLAPIVNKALVAHGPVDMRSIIVQALQMGDECHNRNRAGTSLMIRELAPYLVMLSEEKEELAKVFSFMHANDHFFLNLSMPSAKCTMDAAAHIKGSTLIVAMARNGTDFGIRISGLGDRWFTAPASMVEGLYLPGFKAEDAAPDIGDSVITETSGFGAFAMAASPAIVKFVGGSPEDAIRYTKRMYGITLAENREYRIPALDFRGTPTGIDVRKIVESGILPVINTGIAHKDPGIGMVGAGLVKPPVACFKDALMAFADEYCAG